MTVGTKLLYLMGLLALFVASGAMADNPNGTATPSGLIGITTSTPNPDVLRKGSKAVNTPVLQAPIGSSILPDIGDKDNDKERPNDNHRTGFTPPSVIVVPYGTANTCVASSVTVCGHAVLVPAAPIGTTVALKTPSPYLPQPFAVQCNFINGYIGYQIIDAANVACILQTCAS